LDSPPNPLRLPPSRAAPATDRPTNTGRVSPRNPGVAAPASTTSAGQFGPKILGEKFSRVGAGSAVLRLPNEMAGPMLPRLRSEIGFSAQARLLADASSWGQQRPRPPMQTRGRLLNAPGDRTPDRPDSQHGGDYSPSRPTGGLQLDKPPAVTQVQAQSQATRLAGSPQPLGSPLMSSPLGGQRIQDMATSLAFQYKPMQAAPGLQQQAYSGAYATGRALPRTASPSGLQRTASPVREQMLQQMSTAQPLGQSIFSSSAVTSTAGSAQTATTLSSSAAGASSLGSSAPWGYAQPSALAAPQGIRRAASPVRYAAA